MWGQNDVSVFVVEHDIFSRHSIVNCLGWDRRTHVVGQAASPHELFALLARADKIPRIDAVLVDTSFATDASALESLLRLISVQLSGVRTICMAPSPDLMMARAAARSGACGYFVREQVGLAVASAVCIALHKCFTVTHEMAAHASDHTAWPCDIHILPERKQHPELPQRIEQALELCVLGGLPAEVAANEMGVSTNTIRSYVKEGYRILEAEDGRHYPWTMSPMELAFLRINSLDGEDGESPPERGEFVA